MRITKIIIQLTLIVSFLEAVQAQKVSNIEARFVDGKIRVSCVLQTASPVDLTLNWSDDGGASFNPCLTVSGDLTNQSSGAKAIVWECGKDDIFMGNFVFKITCLPSKQPAATQKSESRTAEPQTTKPRTAKPARDKKNKSHFMFMAGVAADPTISGTLSAGYLSGKWGGYAKVKSNFATIGNAQIDGPDDAFYMENYANKGRFSVSAGVTGQAAKFLLIYAGVGYGSKWVQWKTLSHQLITIDGMSFNGIDPELGLAFKIGNFLIGAGANALIGVGANVLKGTQTSVEANLSLGFIF